MLPASSSSLPTEAPAADGTPAGAPTIPGILPGEVCVQYVRCNKPGCRCQTGERHGPYYYRVWREGIRVRKAYVKAEDVETVRAACQAHKEITQHLRRIREDRVRLAKGIRQEWRRAQTHLRDRRGGRLNA